MPLFAVPAATGQNDFHASFSVLRWNPSGMKALLIYPNARSELIGWGDLGAIAEPLALEYLAAGAIGDGHEVRILDLRLHRDANSALNRESRDYELEESPPRQYKYSTCCSSNTSSLWKPFWRVPSPPRASRRTLSPAS